MENAAEGKVRSPWRSKAAPLPASLGPWLETQLSELSMGGARGVQDHRHVVPTPQDLQPASELGDGALGQRVLAATALGPVTPAHMLSARGWVGGWVGGLRGLKYEDGPHYAWLDASKQELPVHVQGWSKREASPASVIHADISLQDEPAEVVIVGGGPHALAALAALNEGSRVAVIDPGSHFMQAWNTRFDGLEISHLRSPAIAHPVAFDPTALVDFAIDEGRTSELVDAPVSGSWLVSTDTVREKWLKARGPTSNHSEAAAHVHSTPLYHRRPTSFSAAPHALIGRPHILAAPSLGGPRRVHTRRTATSESLYLRHTGRGEFTSCAGEC